MKSRSDRQPGREDTGASVRTDNVAGVDTPLEGEDRAAGPGVAGDTSDTGRQDGGVGVPSSTTALQRAREAVRTRVEPERHLDESQADYVYRQCWTLIQGLEWSWVDLARALAVAGRGSSWTNLRRWLRGECTSRPIAAKLQAMGLATCPKCGRVECRRNAAHAAASQACRSVGR
jgi:hypothetical protein